MLEQILEKLDVMSTRMDVMSTRMDVMSADINDLKQGQVKHDDAIERLHQSLALTQVDHGSRIGGVEDGQSLMSDLIKKVDAIIPVVEATASDVAVIKTVVTAHSKIVNALKAAV